MNDSPTTATERPLVGYHFGYKPPGPGVIHWIFVKEPDFAAASRQAKKRQGTRVPLYGVIRHHEGDLIPLS